MALMALVAQECNEVTVSDEVEAEHGWTWLDMAGLTQVTSSSSNATCIDTQVGRQRKRNTETNRDRGNREMLLKAKHSTARLKHQFRVNLIS